MHNYRFLTHSFPVPIHLISICKWFSARKKHYSRPQTQVTDLYAFWIMYMRHHLQIWKIRHQRWPEMPIISGRSVTQYVAMVTKLLSSSCGAHLVESYCKKSNISDTNWLRYPFSSYLVKIWLSVWRHHLANLHI